MSQAHESPQLEGAFSSENKPQVVVRAGKTYVCSACGTLVEIPADVVGQLVVAVDPAPAPSSKEVPPTDPGARETPQADVPASSNLRSQTVCMEEPSPGSAKSQAPPRRPHRPRHPQQINFAEEQIDGLRVPTAQQLDRALAWVTFHLKVLDRQGTELNRLRQLLKQNDRDQVPCPPPREHVTRVTPATPLHKSRPIHLRQPQAELGVVPEVDPETERGPP